MRRSLKVVSVLLLVPLFVSPGFAAETTPAADVLIPGVDGVSEPKLIERTSPEYPERARRRWIPGKVILRAVIDKNGFVADMETLKEPAETGVGFVEAAKAAVGQWRYEPAVKDGLSVPVYFTVVVSFTMENPKERPEVFVPSVGRELTPPAVDVQSRVDFQLPEERSADRGTVLIDVSLSAAGFPSDIQVVMDPPGEPFWAGIATLAIKQWKFSPGLIDGLPVSSVARMAVHIQPGNVNPDLPETLFEGIEGFFIPPRIRDATSFPPYPADVNKKVEAELVLRFRIDEKGRPALIDIAEEPEGYPQFGNAAKKAARDWRFTAATLGDQPVEADLLVEVKFLPPVD